MKTWIRFRLEVSVLPNVGTHGLTMKTWIRFPSVVSSRFKRQESEDPVVKNVKNNARHYVADDVTEADRPLKFGITPSSIAEAVCGDPARCVVARGVTESLELFGNLTMFEGIWVGPKVTKIFLSGEKVIKYSTPSILCVALKNFDETGNWNLPIGEYMLLPLAKSLRSDYVRVNKKTGLPEKNTNKATKSGRKMRQMIAEGGRQAGRVVGKVYARSSCARPAACAV